MGRKKIIRACSFKPEFTNFVPTSNSTNGTMELNSDEIEAIFLMDYQNMYQEDAAKKMNVSRPTLSRIIKSARKKIATSLILGYEINIIDNRDKFIVALSTEVENDFSKLSNTNDLIALIHLENKKIIEITYLQNPLTCKDKKPSQVLPAFLKEHNVHYWISNHIGEGLKNSLLAKGIFIKKTAKIEPMESITRLFC
jgi:predicted DNA-binding protein (UPF0251 family)